jgi:mannose-6-phosphate isomerase-like protein (cupin superfamily)
MDKQPAFNLFSTFVHMREGGALSTVEVNEAFWRELMAGERKDLNEGWLVAAFRMTDNSPMWEMHPAGEEFLYLLSGAMEVLMEGEDSEQVVELRKGGACVVPRGTWHRQIVHEPCELLGITFGKGTKHRPVWLPFKS